MKQNKDIKKGDKVWMYCEHFDEKSYFPVISVKKDKTLVEVVALAKFLNKEVEVKMYGHRSSSLLSGYEKNYFYQVDVGYTCDYELIEAKTRRYNLDQQCMDAGRALLNLVKYLK